MGDTRADGERLPWLDAPLAPKAKRPRAAGAAGRRARTPIFALLSLFLVAGIGIISYLAGRGSVAVAPTNAIVSRPAQSPQATVALPPLPRTVPPVPPSSTEAAIRIAEAPRLTEVPKPAAQRSVSRPKRVAERAKLARRATRQAKARPVLRSEPARRIAWLTAPVVPASKVVQLGTYRSRWKANAAYRRLVRVYPYLRTLPKVVRTAPSPRGDATLYRLQLREHSPEYARILCRNMMSIGRGCVVLPAA